MAKKKVVLFNFSTVSFPRIMVLGLAGWELLHAARPSQTWLNSFSDDIAVPATGKFNNQGGFLSHLTGPLHG